MRNTEVYNSEIQHIADVCAKDTKAIGFSIPMVYYELGWDSGYYFIDFADLDVYPQSLEYLQNELDNIDEPIIMHIILSLIKVLILINSMNALNYQMNLQ